MSLPLVSAPGLVGKDAVYHPVGDKGGYIKFNLLCKDEDPREGNPNPYRSYMVSYWMKAGGRLVQFLTKGKLIYVTGRLVVDKVGDKYLYTIQASTIELLTQGNVPE